MAQVFEFMVEAGEVFSGLTAGDGQPNATIYVSSGGTVFNSGWDQIDLEDIAFGTMTTKNGHNSQVSYTGNAVSGTLTVTDGVHTAGIQLLGYYTASEFATASDGHGGTVITFTSATTVTGGHGHGHGNAIASPVTS
jgi:hypothetical protein